jgi:hypothetical protein
MIQCGEKRDGVELDYGVERKDDQKKKGRIEERIRGR